MNEIILSILSAAGVSTAVSAVLICVFKTVVSERIKGAIQAEYQQKLETHKAQLKAESDIAVERLKSQLQIAAAERQVRYSRIFDRTAETLATTYEKLLAFHDAVGRYTAIFEFQNTPSKEERRRIAGERQQDFLDYFRPRRIYLPTETACRINKFCNELRSTAFEFMVKVEQRRDDRTYDKAPDHDAWVKVDNFMTEEVPQLLALLEDHFRERLGIIENRQSFAENHEQASMQGHLEQT